MHSDKNTSLLPLPSEGFSQDYSAWLPQPYALGRGLIAYATRLGSRARSVYTFGEMCFRADPSNFDSFDSLCHNAPKRELSIMNYVEIISILLKEMNVTESEVSLGLKQCQVESGYLPIVLWKYGLISIQQLDQILYR